MNNINGGQPITKQISYSLITPQTLTGYTEFFRQNSNRVDGWMEIKVGSNDTWKKQWFVFDDGVLKYNPNPNSSSNSTENEFKMIPMDSVITLRADHTYGNTTILITTIENKIFLRLANTDEMYKWLFCFQKSVALVLSHLTNYHRQSNNSDVSCHPPSVTTTTTTTGNQYSTEFMNHQSTVIWLPSHPLPEELFLRNNNPNHNSNNPNSHDYHIHRSHYHHSKRKGSLKDTHMVSISNEGIPINNTTTNGNTLTGFIDKEAFLRLKSFDVLHNRNSNCPSTKDSNTNNSNKSMYVGSMPTLFSNSIEGGSSSHYDRNSNTTKNQDTSTAKITTAIPISNNLSLNTARDKSRNNSVDKVATSYKDEDSIAFKLECILRSPSASGSDRSRSSSCSSNFSALHDIEGDDEEEDEGMMFELDESVELKNNNNNNTSTDQALAKRSNSSCSTTNPFVGKAFSVSQTLSDAAITPSRRGSNTLSNSYSTNSTSMHDQMRSSINELLPLNYSEHLMWHSGYCTKLGPRSANEDRYVCAPNISDKIQQHHISSNFSSSTGATTSTSITKDIHSLSIQDNNKTTNHKNENKANSLIGGGSLDSAGYFGVYDGHSGHQAAEFLEQNLLCDICKHPEFHQNLELAVTSTCIQTDKIFLNVCEEKKLYCGTTAIGVFVIGNNLLVFNIGDSQAVLCSSGVAIEMSESHKPGRKDEMERIQKAGGWITEEKELYMGRLHRMDLSDPVVRDKAQQVSWVTIHRVCGELSVSRSIGDPDYKQFIPGAIVDAYFLWPDNHNQIFMADLVIPEPQCKLHQITTEDDFIVIASDGLWDVVSSQEAISKVKEAFILKKTPTEAAEELCELSIKLGSSDNVTIVIVRFLHPII